MSKPFEFSINFSFRDLPAEEVKGGLAQEMVTETMDRVVEMIREGYTEGEFYASPDGTDKTFVGYFRVVTNQGQGD